MQHATFERFSAMYDGLKTRCRCSLCNLFWDSHALRELLEKKLAFSMWRNNHFFFLFRLTALTTTAFIWAKMWPLWKPG